MQLVIGSVLTVALVLLLIGVVWHQAVDQLRDLRGAAYMLLIGVPALVLPADLIGIVSLAGGSMALFEIVLAIGLV